MGRTTLLSALVAIAFVAAPSAASACRVSAVPPRIGGDFQAIVLVDISAARDTGAVGWWTWEMESHVDRVIAGQSASEIYHFRQTTGSDGCSSEPPSGQWVLYIEKGDEGERVTEALRLESALNLDPRVAAAVLR